MQGEGTASNGAGGRAGVPQLGQHCAPVPGETEALAVIYFSPRILTREGAWNPAGKAEVDLSLNADFE
jgi:hypothetical protein